MTVAKRMLALMLGAFFVFGLFGFGNSMLQSHHVMGNGAEHHVCPLLGTTPDCVSILDHLSHWQNSFAATFSELVLLILLLGLSCACLWLSHRRLWELFEFIHDVSPVFLYVHSLLPRHSLQQAYSDGILNSKLH